MKTEYHPLSDVQSRHVGPALRIWQVDVAVPNSLIGAGCVICYPILTENDVVAGDHITVKSSVQLWDGLRIEDDFVLSNQRSRYPLLSFLVAIKLSNKFREKGKIYRLFGIVRDALPASVSKLIKDLLL